MARRLFFLATLMLVAACNRAPTRSEAREILRAADPGLDTSTTMATVWKDGPPWFSCAEAIAKFRALADSAVVRNQVGNWRSLVLADWVILRDTSAGSVVEPGWCAATLRDSSARLAGGWRPLAGDSLPSGSRRRGWTVTTGRQRLVVKDAPRDVGRDSVRVDYLLTVAPNENGVALRADSDSTRHQALIRREDGKWVVLSWR
jgi:hypothetical protein